MEAIKNLRALYLAKILFEQSDEAHPLSTRQLIETLEKEYGISAHRVTIYEDMEQLRAFGFDVYKNESKPPRLVYDRKHSRLFASAERGTSKEWDIQRESLCSP